MVNQKPVLEILIPTFKRSHSAQEAIESVLACNDMRLTVRCNSNGFEPVLEKYRNLDDRVNYDSFESNRGFQENLHKLLADTDAKFCMILSDEDRIDVNEYQKILSFLENLSIKEKMQRIQTNFQQNIFLKILFLNQLIHSELLH